MFSIIPKGDSINGIITSMLTGMDFRAESTYVPSPPQNPQIIRSVNIKNREPRVDGKVYRLYVPAIGIVWDKNVAEYSESLGNDSVEGGLVEFLSHIRESSSGDREYEEKVRRYIEIEVIDNNFPNHPMFSVPIVTSVSTSYSVPHSLIPAAEAIYIKYSGRPVPMGINISVGAAASSIQEYDARTYQWVSFMQSLAAKTKHSSNPRIVFALIGTTLYELRLISISEAYQVSEMAAFNLSGYLIHKWAIRYLGGKFSGMEKII